MSGEKFKTLLNTSTYSEVKISGESTTMLSEKSAQLNKVFSVCGILLRLLPLLVHFFLKKNDQQCYYQVYQETKSTTRTLPKSETFR